MKPGRDIWWHDAVAGASDVCAAEPMDAEDMLFILYTSGTTGKPKGVVHTTAGYLVGASTTHRYIFDIKEMTFTGAPPTSAGSPGHSYIVYGPLANGCTTLHVRRARRTFPTAAASGALIDKYGVNILYTAPTAIRTFMRWGTEWPQKYELDNAAPDRHRRRAHQSRSVDLVSPKTSAASAAPSWTPGGKRKPA